MKEETQAWLTKARDDMAAAQVLFDAGLTDGACFHSQQAAEKCLKALFEEHGQHVPRTHDLDVLTERIRNFVTVPDEIGQAATFLSSFGVEVRYPGTDTDLEDATDSLQMANRIVSWIGSCLGE